MLLIVQKVFAPQRLGFFVAGLLLFLFFKNKTRG